MKYNFDEIIEREKTGSLKYDFKAERGVPLDALPMWVADMDFRTAPEIIDALIKKAEHGIYGYTNTKSDFAKVICDWFKNSNGFNPDPSWMVMTPGVVFALSTAIRAFTKPGDGILIQKPVYYPFSNVIKDNGRKLVNNSLVYDVDTNSYSIDFEDFENKIVSENVKLFILCSPHNPVGRVWTKEEIQRLAQICKKHNVLVAADEIHCDFIWGGRKHFSYGSLPDEFLDSCIICTSPSKTFNLAGLQYSAIFIKNDSLRESFKNEIFSTGYDEPSTFAVSAVRAAYTSGANWLLEAKKYIEENIIFMRDYLAKNLPEVKMVETQGTYLTWVDCRGLGYTDEQLNERILNVAKLWLDAGSIFGDEGKQFERFNVACPRTVLKEALDRFVKIK